MDDMSDRIYTAELYKGLEYARGSIAERRDNKTNQPVWVVKLTHPTADASPQKILWLDGPADGEWFPPEDAKWFLMAVSLKRNVSVTFRSLLGAAHFLDRCKAAVCHPLED